MSAAGAATRSNLLRARRRLERVAHGVELLTRKRQALVAELFRAATPAIEGRGRLDEAAHRTWPLLHAALSAHGASALEPLGWPVRPVEVTVEAADAWGVRSAVVERRTVLARSLPGRGLVAGATGPAAALAGSAMERLVELVLDAATAELQLRRLAEALAATTRQVNTLDQRVAPGLRAEISRIRGTLEEREREDHTRLKRLLGGDGHRRQGGRATS